MGVPGDGFGGEKSTYYCCGATTQATPRWNADAGSNFQGRYRDSEMRQAPGQCLVEEVAVIGRQCSDSGIVAPGRGDFNEWFTVVRHVCWQQLDLECCI